jgi:hypothetical protein
MRSAAFPYAGFTIKTFVTEDGVRARAFLENLWVQDLPDVVGTTVDDALLQMQQSLDSWGIEEEGETVLH